MSSNRKDLQELVRRDFSNKRSLVELLDFEISDSKNLLCKQINLTDIRYTQGRVSAFEELKKLLT